MFTRARDHSLRSNGSVGRGFSAGLSTASHTLARVPYNLVHEMVEIRSTPTTVEILLKGAHVASHLRSRGRGQAVSNDEHRPKSNRAHLEWTPSRMVHWAETIGPHTARLFERIMNDKPHPLDIEQKWAIAAVWASYVWGRSTPLNAWR